MKKWHKTAIGAGALFLLGASVVALSQRSRNPQSQPVKSVGAVKSSVASQPAKRRGVKRITSIAHRMRTSPMPFFLASGADVIVLGKVSKVLAVRPTPIDCPDPEGWMGNHTVYAFEVEQYFKGKGAKTVKIHNDGGIVNGIEYYQPDNPGLLVGERYFLFLKSYEDDKLTKKLGFIPCGVGKNTYKLGDADELFPAEAQRAKIRIENGVLVQATD